MGYEVKILADSVPHDYGRADTGDGRGGLLVPAVRLTTWQLTFPRFLLAELNTHRMLSRNSASSRAIPPEKQIARVMDDPFIPETFNLRVKGMGVGAAVDERTQRSARAAWIAASREACGSAQHLLDLGLDKSRINRLLEPFLWHTAIVSGTEWEHFFALRDHPDAQPEFQILAHEMRLTWLSNGAPARLAPGEWHQPMLTATEKIRSSEPHKVRFWNEVAAGRIARVSFDTQDKTEDLGDSRVRTERLMGNGHFSPLEHVARPFTADDWARVLLQKKALQSAYARELVPLDQMRTLRDQTEFVGNFRGWVQMRKGLEHEAAFHKHLEAQAHERMVEGAGR